MESTSFLEWRLNDFLARMADGGGGPRGGSAAAIAIAMAAAVVELSARLSPDWPEAEETARQAEALRRRVAPLAQADADAYADYLSTRGLPDELEGGVKDVALSIAAARATALPLLIAEAGAEAARLAAVAAAGSAAAVRPDAVAAAQLAAAGARAAAHLVSVDAEAGPDDERVRGARTLADRAEADARRALES